MPDFVPGHKFSLDVISVFSGSVDKVFSGTMIARLKPREKDYFETDGDGLVLKVLATGRKIWYVRFWKDGKDRKVKIGEYPAMSLSAARQKRDEIKLAVREGRIDRQRKVCKDIAELWFKSFSAGKSAKHVDTTHYRLTHYALPLLGPNRELAAIQRVDILTPLRELAEKGTIETARRVASVITQIFDFALDQGYIDTNPAQRLTHALPSRQAEHFSAIYDEAQLGILLNAINNFPRPVTKMALITVAYCFPRVGELLASRWKEIDLDTALWTMPAGHTKRKRDHLIPLPRQIVAALSDYREWSCAIYRTDRINELLVFPALRPQLGKLGCVAITEAACLMMLRRCTARMKIPPMTIHGFRHTASTILHSRGENSIWIEKQLAHLDPNRIRAVYNAYEYLDERRGMLQRYADYLDTLCNNAAKS